MFTPGPWAVGHKDGSCRLRVYHDESLIADCDGAMFIETNLANAALISASPEILEALEYMLHCFTSKAPNESHQLEAIVLARKVITKARTNTTMS